MKHKAEVIIQTKYLLLGMLACIVLAALTACSDGDTYTGGQAAYPTYPEVEAARSLLRKHSIEAAEYPTILSEKWSHAYGVHSVDLIYLSKLWIKKNAKEPKWGACLIYHEYLHSQGIGHGAQMNRLVDECESKI